MKGLSETCHPEDEIILTYSVFLIKLEAAPPVDPSEICRCQFDDVQFKGLFHEDDVVFSHAKAVEIAREQGGAKRNRTDLLNLPQRGLLLVFP